MDYLYGRNRSVAARLGRPARPVPEPISAVVVVIGGGDTAMDCVGTAPAAGAGRVAAFAGRA